MKKIDSDLDRSQQTGEVVLLSTYHPDGTELKGVVLHNGREIAAVWEVTSLELDGMIVIPKKWIKSIRNGNYEKCATEILSRNVSSTLDPDWLVASNTVKEFITHLKARDIWPAVELIYDDCGSLYVGPVFDISDESFKIFCYDASGNWEQGYELPYDEIFKVEVDSKYVRHFNEYMRPK